MLGITYSEFDNIVGPQLQYSFPPKVISAETFETLSDYAIVGSHLCNKSIVVKFGDIQFLSYSAVINQKKYHRNTLTFSCGVVLVRDADIEPYEILLRKLSLSLQALELEQEFLFKKSTKDSRLPHILKDLYESVIEHGEAFVEIDPANILAVKLFESPVPPRKLEEFEVPVLLYDRQLTSNLPWDVSLQHILPKIDGVSCIKVIAHETDMDVATVIMALRILLFYGCIIITSVFRFSNVYQLLPDAARRMLSDSALLHEIEEFSLVVPDGDCDYDLEFEFKSDKNNHDARLKLGDGAHRGQLHVGTDDAHSLGASTHAFTVNSVSDLTSLTQDANNSNVKTAAKEPRSRIPGILRFLFRLKPGRTVAQALFGGQDDCSGVATGRGGSRRRQINLTKYLAHIDIRRLVAIAQEKKLIQRLYEFPTKCQTGDGSREVASTTVGAAPYEERSIAGEGSELSTSASARNASSYDPYEDPEEDDYELASGVPQSADTDVLSHQLHTPHTATSGSKGKSMLAGAVKVATQTSTRLKYHMKRPRNRSRDSLEELLPFMVDEDDEERDIDSDSSAIDENNSSESVDGGDASSAEDSYIESSSNRPADSDASDRNTDTESAIQTSELGDDYQQTEALNADARKAQLMQHRQQLIDNLRGAESLDSFCCSHELAPSIVLKAASIFITYKASAI